MKHKMVQAGLLALAAAGLAVPAGLSAQDPLAPGIPNVSFPGEDGTALKGYLSLPAGSGKAPAVLMIHEWWGLNSNIMRLADALAAEGYVVLAGDAFRGRVAQTAQEAAAQVQGTPQERMAADLDSALRFLRSQPRVDAARVASLGFCFGGTQSMYMGTRQPELAAVVIFYGSGPITDAGRLGSMRGPVLGIYGQEDGNIPAEKVREFEKALQERGVPHALTIYAGVGHAFVNSRTYDAGGAPEEAWQQVLGFLRRTLRL
jgi:carboxymethylenebutenolidase